jgi:hypothetical protein
VDLTRYVDDLQRRLATAAEAGGTESREIAQRLAAPLEAATRLLLLEALSDAAGEISAELAPGSVDVRLRGGEPSFVVTPSATAGGAPAPPGAAPTAGSASPSPAGADAEEGTTTRTTLRLPDHLKAQVEVAAARDGVSVNTWLVRAVAAALEQSGHPPAPSPRGGTRLTGWVR